MSKLFIFSFLFVVNYISAENMPENWIDPYDMSPSKDYLQYSDSISSMHAHFVDKNRESDCSKSLGDAYFKRMINMLLNSVHEDYIDPDVYSGHLFFKIDAEKYAFLKNFADGAENDLEKVDKILGDILTKPTHEFLQEYLESWFHKCLNVLLSREGIICIVVASYAFVIFKLFHAKLYSWHVLKFLLINFILFDFIFTWVHLYQKAQAEDLAQRIKYQNLPVECNPEDMTSWQFLANIFSSEDRCKKYYEVRYQDIFYKVSPGVVLTEMFARTIQYPAKSIGKAFGEVCYGIFDSFPWPLNIVILPVCLYFFATMTCVILSLVLNKRMHFNLFFNLISFSFGGESTQNVQQDTISGPNLEKLLNITQSTTQNKNKRKFIEEIPVKEEIKHRLNELEERKSIENTETKTAKKTDEKKYEKTDDKKEEEHEELIENIEARSEIGAGDHQ